MNAKIDVTNICIETPRLLLRAWCEADLDDFFEYASVPGVGEAAGWNHHESIEVSKRILDGFIGEKKTFALLLKENAKVIGSLGLEELDPDPLDDGKFGREIGYVLSKEYWGRGLMTEAVHAVIDYCFRVLDYDFLTCGHFVQNSRSRRVIEKNGFIFFGESRYETRYDTTEISRNYILRNPRKQSVDVTNVRIETPRLLLRAWRQTDLQDLFDYCSQPEVGEPAGWSAFQTLDEAQKTLNCFLAEPYTFALEHKDTGKVIGSLCTDWLDPNPELDNAHVIVVGYDLSKDHWGQGLMSEALQAVIPYCFDTLCADYIQCSIFVRNRRSQRVAEKCGFRRWKQSDFSASDGTAEPDYIYLLPNPKKVR